MKKNKIIRLTLMILICLLIILVGFVGIYMKKANAYKNILPDYTFASDLKGATVYELEVDDSNETIYYDKEGKKVDSSTVTDENKDEYTSEEKPVNAKENLTKDNYKEVAKIMKQRLKFLKTDQYRLDLDEKTGKIVLTFEYAYPDDIKSILPMEGRLQLVDSNTEDTILDYTDFKSVEASYASTDDGYTAYLHLKLNDSGLQKINEIDKYKIVPASDGTNTEESTENTEDESTENKVNKLKIMFDEDEIAEVTYDDILLTGKTLRVATASNLTSDSTIQSKLNTNTVISKLATMGKLPVVYNITAEEYVQSNIASYIQYVAIAFIIVCTLVALYFIIKFKKEGFIVTLTFGAIISLFLIIIRYAKIEISINGFVGFAILILLNTVLVKNMLMCIKDKNRTFSENVKHAYLKSIDVFAISLIVFVVFSFSAMTSISTMGLLVFWGWLVILLGNLALTVPMLAIVKK